MRRARAAATLAVLASAVMTADAVAQAPGYGGGLLPYTKAPRTFNPSVGITLQSRGPRLALRFDTLLWCKGGTEEATGRVTVPFDGTSFAARRASVVKSGRLRLEFAWTIRGAVAGSTATGSLRIAGRRRIGRGRWVRCHRHPERGFQARAGAQPVGAAATPPPAASYFGVSDQAIVDGLPASVVLRSTRDGGRVAARWTAVARCRRGPSERLVNFTPATSVRADGSFSRTERFSVRYANALVRYRVRFSGRFLTDGATGQLRMRARVFDRRGRRLRTRCDTRSRGWRAHPPDPAAGAPTDPGAATPGTGTPAPGGSDTPPRAVPGAWSLHMVSEPGDYIGQGGTYDFGSPQDWIDARGRPEYVGFSVLPGGRAPDWAAGFFAPEGQTLRAGTTYTDNALYDPTPNDAGMSMSGESRACSTGVGSFTIDALAYDPDGALRTAKVRWTFRCHPSDPALRGSWDFAAA